MKLWYDEKDFLSTTFHTEQFLLLGSFETEVLSKNKDFSSCQKWKADIQKLVSFSDIKSCDYILYPRKLDTGIQKYIELGLRYKKPVISFYVDDADKPFSIDTVTLYRTSFYRSKRKKNEYAMPAWSADLLEDKELIVKKKNIEPIVSFCGAMTHQARSECIEILNRNSAVKCSFIIRSHFWGGKIHDPLLRQEYIQNITNSDLVLCCRGAGNFSYRLYECLSLGRIPIIIDTDVVLPCSDVIDWNRFIITTPEKINEAVNAFWNITSADEFKSLQEYAREIYSKYICPSGFTKYLTYTLKNQHEYT